MSSRRNKACRLLLPQPMRQLVITVRVTVAAQQVLRGIIANGQAVSSEHEPGTSTDSSKYLRRRSITFRSIRAPVTARHPARWSRGCKSFLKSAPLELPQRFRVHIPLDRTDHEFCEGGVVSGEDHMAVPDDSVLPYSGVSVIIAYSTWTLVDLGFLLTFAYGMNLTSTVTRIDGAGSGRR